MSKRAGPPSFQHLKYSPSKGSQDTYEEITDLNMVSPNNRRSPTETYLAESHHETGRKFDKLFIGGISLGVCLYELEQALEQAIQAYGKLSITMVKRVKNNNYSGYGYISSSDMRDLDGLLLLKTYKFNGLWVGIKQFLTRKSDIRALKSNKDNRKIHIKGINARITEGDLDAYFSRFGDVNHIQINKSQYTGSYKGFAFIEFAHEHSVKLAIQDPVHHFKGVSLYCEKSKTRHSDGSILTKADSINSNCEDSDCFRGQGNSLQRSKTFLASATVHFVDSNHRESNVQFNVRKPIVGRSFDDCEYKQHVF